MNATFDLERAIIDHESNYIYTYPFKGAYRALSAPLPVMADWTTSSGPLNVYVHIPFCEMKCAFCYLFTTTHHTRDSVEDYAETIRQEIRLATDTGRFSKYRIRSIYFGGGTPTVMNPASLEGIVGELQRSIPHYSDCGLAIESAPGRATSAQLKQLRSTGFSRISFGVQSFNNEELMAMRRHHTCADAVRAMREAHEVGFQNVNVDLIYGLEGQTLSGWERSLSAAVNGRPESITVYPLTFRRRTLFGRSFRRNPRIFPSPAARQLLYEFARNFLVAEGYQQLTMVAFVRDGGVNQHEQNEFLGVPTVGFGAGALSYGPNYHYTSGHYDDETPNTTTLSQYVTTVRHRRLPIRAGIYLTRDEHMRRHLILRLLSIGVNTDDFVNRFGVHPMEDYGDLIHLLRDHGLADICVDRLQLTSKGVRVSSLVADLFASDCVKEAASGYG